MRVKYRSRLFLYFVFIQIGFADHRGSKFFPILSLVQFPNSECIADDLRFGTCYVHQECKIKGGLPINSCAMTFGRCCIFQTTCNGVMQYNTTHFVNPSFPSNDSMLFGECQLTVNLPLGTCSLLLEMLEFNISQPVGTVCADDFAYVKDKPFIPVICGQNSGQHMYIDVAGDSVVNFIMHFSGKIVERVWNIKLSYISCDDPKRPPPGCLQYFTDMNGNVRSFNFYDIVAYNDTQEEPEEEVFYITDPHHAHAEIETVFIPKPHLHHLRSSSDTAKGAQKNVTKLLSRPRDYYRNRRTILHHIGHYDYEDRSYLIVPPNATHLANQNYAMCVARAIGVCRIKWSSSTFDVTGYPSRGQAVRGDSCQEDYLLIPNGFVDGEASTHDRYCGNRLGPTGANVSVPVSSDAQPFLIRFVTNGSDPNGIINRGFSMAFTQIFCKDCIGTPN